MHSDKAYLSRIFQMPLPDTALQENVHTVYRQVLEALPNEYHGLVLTLMDKQSKMQTDCCVRSFIQGYELAVGIEWKPTKL